MLERSLSLVAVSLVAAGFIGSAAAETLPAQQVVITVNRIQADNDAYARYRAAVLGHDAAFSGAPAIRQPSSGFVPGSYAQYLIRNGESESAALARAARFGEQPVYRVVHVAAAPLSAHELNEKRLGRTQLTPAILVTPVASADVR